MLLKMNAVMIASLGFFGGLAVQAADITGSGTNGDIPVFTGATSIGNSVMSQSGTTVTVNGTVNSTGGYQISGTKVLSMSGVNVAVGELALNGLTSGFGNTADGGQAVYSNTTGDYNTGAGFASLALNTTNCCNSAFGAYALNQATGESNTAIGFDAAGGLTTGSNNIAIGEAAGYGLTTGSNNIDIGTGQSGTSSDSGVIRIGTSGYQSATFIQGIYGVTTGLSNAVDVVVDGNGQLGTISSSIRYKEDVQDMAQASDRLFQLRPVTFRYKQPYADGSKPVDYGLIAEEVAQVYPDLVSKNAQGQVETVQYSKLTPMLLNEVQKQHQLLEQQTETIKLLEQRLAALEAARK